MKDTGNLLYHPNKLCVCVCVWRAWVNQSDPYGMLSFCADSYLEPRE